MHVEEAPGATREGMALLIPLARSDVSSEGDDLRIAIQRLPPVLPAATFHAFFALFGRHRSPPPTLP
jgi:hypothetical protein